MRWTPGRLITLGVVVLLSILVARLGYSVWSIQRLRDHGQRVDRLQGATEAVLSVHALLSHVEATERAYLLNGEAAEAAEFDADVAKLQDELDRLDREVAGVPGKYSEASAIRRVVNARVAIMRSRVELGRAGRLEEARGRFRASVDEDASSHVLATMIGIEKSQHQEIDREQESVSSTFALAVLTEFLGAGLRATVLVLGAVLLYRLICSQGEARRVIDRQRKMFEATLMSLGDGMIATDVEGRITTLNEVAGELIGTSRGSAIGTPIAEVFRTYDRPGGIQVDCAVQVVLAARPGIDRRSAEAFVKCGDGPGDFRPLSLTASRIVDDQGRTSGSVLVFRDITEIRRVQSELGQSEARFRQFADALPISMFVMARDRTVEYLNRAAVDYLGPQAGAPGDLAWIELIHPQDRARMLARLAETIRGGMSPAEDECRFLRHDGEYRRFLVRMVPLDLDEAGARTWLGTGIDIHDRWLAETELRKNQQRIRLSIEAGSVLPWEVDLATGVFRADPIFYEVHNFPEDRCPASSAEWAEYMHPDDRRRYIEATARNERGESPQFVFDYRASQKDGSLRWFQVRGCFTDRDESGRPSRCCGTTIDITREKLAQIEADALLSRLQAIYRASERVAVIAVGNDGVVTDFNVGAELLLGYAAGEVVGRITPLAFHDPEDCGEAAAEMAAALGVEPAGPELIYEYLARFGVLEREWTWVRKDGSTLVVDLVHTLLRDASGGVIGCLGIARDVTDRKRVETELRQSEERFRVLAEALPHQTWVMRPDLTFEYVNGPSAEYTGLTAAEYPPGGFFPLMHPDDLARADAEAGLLHHAGEPYEVEFRLRRKDGAYRWMLSRSVPVRDAAGRVIRWVGTTTDIHERWTAREALAASEKRFQDAAEALNGYIYEADLVGRKTSLSKGFDSFLGYPAEESGSVDIWASRIHPDDLHRVWDEMGAHAEARLRRVQYEYRLRHKDGHYLDVWDSAVLEYDAAGTLVRAVGHVIDVSDRKRFAEALQEADRRKDDFLATLSHELRNPLAPVRSAAQAMRLTWHDRLATLDNLDIIDRQLAQMVRLVDDLLDVTRITRGKVHLRVEPVALDGLLRGAIETCQPHLRASGQRIALRLAEPTIWLDADPVRLEQVFANLIHNACKYTPEGGSISVESRREGDRAVVAIRDDGIGIAPEQIGRIFEMFSQAEQAIDRSQGGLGVGLSLVRSLVDLHGGKVEARSEGLGLGSEFVVDLPARADAPTPVQAAPAPPAVEKDAAPPRDRILVVDDNKDAANMLATVLRLYGHDVEVAYDGEAGLLAAETFLPTVVVLDIGMPRLNGYDACRALRTMPCSRDALLIAVTGWGQEEDRERSRHAGFDHHLVKPVETATLLALLAETRPARV